MKLIFLGLFLVSCIGTMRNINPNYQSFGLVASEWSNLLNEKELEEKLFHRYRNQDVSAIVIHHTDQKTLKQYMKDTVLSGFGVHIGIDKTGKLFGETNPFLVVTRTVPKMDEVSIHIVLEGNEEEILSKVQRAQLEKASLLIEEITRIAGIPKTNRDINSLKGIFTHSQAKKKFGNFVDLNECGSEKVLKAILSTLSGKYVPELEWEGRYENSWVSRKEKNIKNITSPVFDRGRGITDAPLLELSNLEKTENNTTPEAFRLQYKFKQKIKPTCVVLHFTAIPSFKRSQEVLESRGLSATIMVDKDAKAYQLVDYLDDMAQAATGTNQDCIQIEIVGKNTDELMNNPKQTEKVKALVLELSNKYRIPLNNQKIESLQGIFSHTQAKKKFGGSVALVGKDFDPGEPYMKLVLEAVGGKYYEEKDWFERNSENWIILYADFQP